MTFLPSLYPVLVPGWPKLAWVLRLDREGHGTVFHGPAVEVRPDWVFEGIWDGNFQNGDFDRSELVFGSGIRVRGSQMICVGSSTTLDRLWTFESGNQRWVSNTLPGVLAASSASMDMSYQRYRGDLESIVFGLKKYKRFLPFSEGNLELVYFENLWLDAGEPARIEKPHSEPKWQTFADYRAFLSDAARRLGENARDLARGWPCEVVATISSGYDSTASAVIAQEAGATRAFTLRRARSLIPRSDSGAAIAGALGLACRSYDQPGSASRGEEWLLAALGWSMDFNLAAFDYPDDRLTVLFTGFHGDKFWDLHDGYPNSEIIRGDPSGLGFTEYRLVRGVVNCAVPFWGVRHADAMKAISQAPEMAAWTLGTDYDRPIPRRIAEAAGVPRAAFGQRKSATTTDDHVYWPVTESVDLAYRSYLRSRGGRRPPVHLARFVNQLESSALSHFRSRAGIPWPRVWIDLPESDHLFPWAVDLLAKEMGVQLGSGDAAGRSTSGEL
jgi:hypothetical protein